MSVRFTIVPADLRLAARDFLRWVMLDPGVIVKVAEDTAIFFAGSPEVAKEAPNGEALASIRILGRGVFEVDLDGYEASVAHAGRYVRMAITTFPCRIFDAESGDDLTIAARDNPAVLFTS